MATPSLQRDSLNGAWILDKTRGNWQMKEYLEIMQVDPLAIEAHEKGDRETDTIHTITLDNTNNQVTIVKRSRVNNDLVVQLTLGQEATSALTPGNRPKTLIAHSKHPGHLKIQSTLQTLNNGQAQVTDEKELQPGGLVMLQQLTIVNGQTQKKHQLTRYFVPYTKTPPHLVIQEPPKK